VLSVTKIGQCKQDLKNFISILTSQWNDPKGTLTNA
jgi:hypothetical protein